MKHIIISIITIMFTFSASAKEVVLEGAEQPSGYTEPILHEMRLKQKVL